MVFIDYLSLFHIGSATFLFAKWNAEIIAVVSILVSSRSDNRSYGPSSVPPGAEGAQVANSAKSLIKWTWSWKLVFGGGERNGIKIGFSI